jgi:hypothetical protein
MKNLTTFFERNFVHEKSFNDLSTQEYQERKIGK